MDRAQLRIADLKERQSRNTRLMNVKIPAHVHDTITPLARQLGTSKTEIIIALLNAGLERAGKLRGRNGRRGK
jgi:GH24 family phage-related lysozyme (muramidase)